MSELEEMLLLIEKMGPPPSKSMAATDGHLLAMLYRHIHGIEEINGLLLKALRLCREQRDSCAPNPANEYGAKMQVAHDAELLKILRGES